MNRAIILAAGRGERLVNGYSFPKPLKEVNGLPLIVRVLRNLEFSAVREVAIVVGYLGDVLISGIKRFSFDLEITFFHNDEWHKPNGTSLLKAKSFVSGPTYLMMSDHVWSTSLIEPIRRYPLAHDEAVLGVDFNITRCFDLEDATKVEIDGDRVVRIGKQLETYQALDTGVFKITPAVIEALERVEGPKGCSLSDGMAALAATGRMRIVDVKDAMWIDVDTPDAHAYAEMLLANYGQELRPMPQVQPSVIESPALN
ncbi:MAG: NTP transferase domain-containing protein [Deltaproteobacteria bacterium]|nr:NTP transferase domain-containing protein [Deltaproteobacteria bacterium]